MSSNGSPIDGGKLFALPFDLQRGPIERHSRLLDHLAANASWFASAETEDAARENAAWMMTDGSFWKWEIWNGGQFAGMILLSRITPRVDGLFHFTLLPYKESGVTVVMVRRLLWNWLGHVFDQFQLQRISAEVPEHAIKLAHFYRQRLAFRYEGEGDVERLKKNKGVLRFDTPGTPTWIAAHGSRRERCHWSGEKWSDLLLLRILRDEYTTRASSGELPKATRESLEDSDVARIEARSIPAVDPSGNAAGVPTATV